MSINTDKYVINIDTIGNQRYILRNTRDKCIIYMLSIQWMITNALYYQVPHILHLYYS